MALVACRALVKRLAREEGGVGGAICEAEAVDEIGVHLGGGDGLRPCCLSRHYQPPRGVVSQRSNSTYCNAEWPRIHAPKWARAVAESRREGARGL